MNCRSVLKPGRRVMDRDGFGRALCFIGELLVSPTDEAMTGLIVFPQRGVRPLAPIHVPKSDREPQKQLLPGRGWRAAEPFVLLDVDVFRQKEGAESDSLVGAEREGLAPILKLVRAVRGVGRIHFFAA